MHGKRFSSDDVTFCRSLVWRNSNTFSKPIEVLEDPLRKPINLKGDYVEGDGKISAILFVIVNSESTVFEVFPTLQKYCSQPVNIIQFLFLFQSSFIDNPKI